MMPPNVSMSEKPPGLASNWLPLLVLLLLVIPLRGWLMWNTEVLARDGIVYINYALQLETQSWQEVLCQNHHHPGYPVSILVMSVPVRHWLGPADSFTMQLSAQLASNLAAVLLILPMYFLGKFFFERRVAFWGTLLFQYLPVSGQLLSDGVSEPLFFLLTSSAFLCALWAVRRQSMVLFIGSGIFCGLAYLTRPEGALVLVTTLLVLAIGPFMRGWQQNWQRNFRQGLVMTLAGLAIGSLYFGFTHSFSNKPSTYTILGNPFETDLERKESARPSDRDTPAQADSGASSHFPPSQYPLFAMIFGNTVARDNPLMTRLGHGILTFGSEYFQIFHYVGCLAFLFGVYGRWRRLLTVPEFMLPVIYVLLSCVVVLALACKVGYLSNRHLLGMAIWGVFFAAAGFCDLPRWLGQWWPSTAAVVLQRLSLARISLLLLLAFVGLCMPKTVQKLHAAQAGNHGAGLWLHKNVKKGDLIRDDHNWARYYAGEIFHQAPEPPPGRKTQSFVVMSRGRDPKFNLNQDQKEKELRDAGAEVVFHWPENRPQEQARVLIFAMECKAQSQGWWDAGR